LRRGLLVQRETGNVRRGLRMPLARGQSRVKQHEKLGIAELHERVVQAVSHHASGVTQQRLCHHHFVQRDVMRRGEHRGCLCIRCTHNAQQARSC
jgi:hypothetical protein